jgi:choline dehydrogenase
VRRTGTGYGCRVSEYEYVIVGAGAAGCVLANRLSAGGASVCLLESGGSDRHLGVRAPAAFPTLFQTARDWNLLSEPEPGLHGRRWYLPRGRMLGGSSSMNAMFYVRGHRSDFDGWVDEHGAVGWGYDEMLPLFKRSEHNDEIRDEFHGTTGELNVTRRRWLSKYWQPFTDSAVAAGVQRVDDYNGAQMEGASLLQATTRRGRRHSAAEAFLGPARGRANLTVETGANARRILIENGRAVGVEHANGTARAAREVIVAAGSYGSPQLLMLSGVGPAGHLREHGIEVLVDQANVGQHLQEHPMAFVNWRVSGDTLDDADSPRNLLPWLLAGRGKLSSNIGEAVVHWRSDPSLEAPDFQIPQAPVYFWEHGFRKTGAPALSVGAAFLRPRSRGAVTLRSADPGDHPRVLNNALTSEGEVDAMLRALELIRDIASRPPLRDMLGEELNPSSTIRGRDGLTAWLRATCEHEYHPSCTCRIGSPEEGVVDTELRVHGVEALRVADASVQPRIVSANTQAVTLAIAERCSDLVLGRYGAMASMPRRSAERESLPESTGSIR